jgi:hypothetical protein
MNRQQNNVLENFSEASVPQPPEIPVQVHFIEEGEEERSKSQLPAFVTRVVLSELFDMNSLDTLASTPSTPEKNGQS